MEPKIIWLFALVFLLTTKYSFAVDGDIKESQDSPKGSKQLLLTDIDEIYSRIKNAFKILFRVIKENVSDSINTINDAVKKWNEIVKPLKSYIHEGDNVGPYQRAADSIYNEYQYVKNNLASIDERYHSYSTLYSTLDSTNYSSGDNGIFLQHGDKAITEMFKNISDTLKLNCALLLKLSLPDLREKQYLDSVQNETRESGDQCHTCDAKAQKMFWLYRPLIKSEIQGMLAISYANLVRTYTKSFRSQEGSDDFNNKFFGYIEKSHARIKNYYQRIRSLCFCKTDPWGYRMSKSRGVIEGEPMPSSNRLDFCVKGVVNATLFLYYSDPNISEIHINQNGIEGYFKRQTINMPIKYLTETNMLHCFRLRESSSKLVIGYISAETETIISKSFYVGRKKSRLHVEYSMDELFYTINSDDLDAEWMIRDVARSPFTESSMAKGDLYWCRFNGELPNSTPVKVGKSTYVVRQSISPHLNIWKSWTPRHFDVEKNQLDLDRSTMSDLSYDILTGCEVEWTKATNCTIPYAVVASKGYSNPLLVPVFICRGHYKDDPSRIGRFDGHQCTVNDGEDHVITDYEILIQPRK